MEFELQLGPGTTASASRALHLTGLQVACAPATQPSMQLPPLDDRHGLIRAVAALATLPSAQLTQASHASSGGTKAVPGGPIYHHYQQHRRWHRWGGTLRRAGGMRSPARAAGPAASVSVAASEVVAHKAAVVHKLASLAKSPRPLQQLLAGGVAGAVSKTLVAPLERVSTMIMTDGHRAGFGAGEALAHAWREGGLAGLFRGNAATLAKIFPASAIQFAVFHCLKDALLSARGACSVCSTRGCGNAGGNHAPGAQQQLLQQEPRSKQVPQAQHAQHDDELSNAERLLAGAAAGAASVSVTYPLESARTLMSVAGGMEGSLVSVCRRVVASGGIRALYRGFQATLLGDVMGNALGFTLYEVFNRAYKDANGGVAAPPSVRGVIGALSAATVLTATMPLEVVRRRLQVQGTLGRPLLYRGTLDCIAQIARKEGLHGFYRASLPSYLKVAPSIGCMYFLYELLTKHLDTAGPSAGTGSSPARAAAGSTPAASAHAAN